jgi:hypothetical protein
MALGLRNILFRTSDPGGRAAAGRAGHAVAAHPHVFIDAGITLDGG